ncbi:MAG: hypothetical protein HKP37_03035 [Boseongicola sp.]|nr:hypothetical protein [Boseongicola sp.]
MLALLATPTFAFADCASESLLFGAALESRGYAVREIGEVQQADEACSLESIVFSEENLIVDIAKMTWHLQGHDGLSSGEGLLNFNATLTDLRMSPLTTDRWVSYMLAQQNRRNTIDAMFSASWDLTNGVFEIETLDVDLPGDNRVTFEQRVSGADTALLTGNPTALQALSLDHMALTIENRGFADTLILGPLVASLSEVPGAPETVVEGTKRDFRALVSNLPPDVFDTDTKNALVNLIDAGPTPWGELTVKIAPNPSISLAPFFAAQFQNLTPDGVSKLFQGGKVEVTFAEDTGDE